MKKSSIHQQHVGRAVCVHRTVTNRLINGVAAALVAVCLIGAAPVLAQAPPKPPAYFNEFLGREAWRFPFVQQVVLKLGESAIDYPPMQDPASFNLTSVKAKIEAAIKAHESQ